LALAVRVTGTLVQLIAFKEEKLIVWILRLRLGPLITRIIFNAFSLKSEAFWRSQFHVASDTANRVREVHPENAPDPMEVTELGIVMLVRELHQANASHSMEVTELGIVMLVREVHPENALDPMEVTEFGMVMLVREVQSKNATYPMEVTGSPLIVFGITPSRLWPVYPVIETPVPLA